ncbi:MAG: hypothetical protein Q7J05_05925 [Paludibacter sp.]|nr:hypothetical protein [Paludibacter sp.]
MNRELLVTLIRKNIDELTMLTEGFMEMTNYPAAIINLAKNKTDDIWGYINQLENIKSEELQQIKDNQPDEQKDIVAVKKEESSEIIIPVTEEEELFEKFEEKESINVSEEEVILGEDESLQSVEREEKSEEEEEEEEVIEDVVEEEEELQEVVDVEDVDEVDEADEVEQVEPEENATNNIEILENKITIEYTETVDNDVITADKSETERIITTTETIEKKVTFAEKIAGNGISRNELHARTENGGINATIGNKKIDDIRHAISLGDRFRFQRELFRNNGEDMNKTLSYINMLATYNEVVSFLQSKYGWEEGHPVAEDFYQIIKRKF